MKLTHNFPAEPRSVAAARRFATSALAGSPTEVVEAVELMVSELASNCIRHVNASFELTVAQDEEEIRVEVVDRGGGRPAMRAPEPQDPSGRGLLIVDMLSARWGVRFDANSAKTVWFTLTLPPGGTARASAALTEANEGLVPDAAGVRGRASARRPDCASSRSHPAPRR